MACLEFEVTTADVGNENVSGETCRLLNTGVESQS
jgi:hypothetical protein